MSRPPRRPYTFLTVYLLLRQDDRVLLLRRKNTGFKDGYYSVIAGHVEEGESATDAMVREAFEEAGITIAPSHLKVAHVMHVKVDRTDLALVFECHTWTGEVRNQEPEKCDELRFFPLDALPEKTVEYLRAAIDAIARGDLYSECGFPSSLPQET